MMSNDAVIVCNGPEWRHRPKGMALQQENMEWLSWRLRGCPWDTSIRVTSSSSAPGSSGACDGLMFMQSKQPGIHLRLALAGLKLFEELKTALPVPIEYTACGGMIVIETEAELEAMTCFAVRQREIGLAVSLITGDAARRLDPCLGARILGATHSPLDGRINPVALTLGFAGGATKPQGGDTRRTPLSMPQVFMRRRSEGWPASIFRSGHGAGRSSLPGPARR